MNLKKHKPKLDISTKQLIYESYFDQIYKLALYIIQDTSLAEDVTQEAFTVAFEKYHQLKDSSKLSAWLKAITFNLACSCFNKNTKVTALESEKIHYLQDKFTVGQTNDFTYKKELEEELKKAIRLLPKEHQEVIILKYYYDLEIVDIAEIVGVPKGTVKSRLSRARRKLKQVLRNAKPSSKKGVYDDAR